MSWSLSVPKTSRSEFGVAVDGAIPSPAIPDAADVVEAQREQVAAAKDAIKALAASGGLDVDADLYATAYGHANPGHKFREGWSSDTISISVSQAK